MADPSAEISREEPKMVRLSDRKLGHEIKTPGQSFRLKNIFSAEANQLGGDKFDQVYFKTSSGNIYFMDGDGYIVNRNESIRNASISEMKVKTDELEKKELRVGSAFEFGNGARTTSIVEIVPTNPRIYAERFLGGLPKNDIIEEFRRDMPEMPNRKFSTSGFSRPQA